jgi:hypothetical protein
VFVTQTPKDVPGDVLAQLGSRIQHQLRAFHPPMTREALRATVSTTTPQLRYDLGSVLTTLATGEERSSLSWRKGARHRSAWTRLDTRRVDVTERSRADKGRVIRAPAQIRYGHRQSQPKEMLRRKLERQQQQSRQPCSPDEQAAAAEQQQADYERMLRGQKKVRPRASPGSGRRAPGSAGEENEIDHRLPSGRPLESLW